MWVFKLPTCAERCWRRVHSPHLVALIQACIKFHIGETRILPDLPIDSVVNPPVDATPDSAILSL